MLIDERRQQVRKLLQEIKGLTPEERQRITTLDLPIFESLVIAELCRAHRLFARDHTFNWKEREEAWHEWRDHMMRAIEGSLRYHTNDALIVTIGVCAALFPIIHRGAGLMGYKTLDDIVMLSQRAGNANKKERAEMRFRIKDIVTRVSLWWCPPNEIMLSGALAGHSGSFQTEPIEAAGIALDYGEPHGVVRLVECVLPIRWQTTGSRTLIMPISASS